MVYMNNTQSTAATANTVVDEFLSAAVENGATPERAAELVANITDAFRKDMANAARVGGDMAAAFRTTYEGWERDMSPFMAKVAAAGFLAFAGFAASAEFAK